MSSSQPLVTIVTPTFNRRSLLSYTVNSVRAQTYPNVEHIVMDGASADGTVEFLRQVETTYQMRWESKADAGMYSAINSGLAKARGEIVAYLNSDDLYFPWTIEVVVAAFRRHPEADFIFGDAIVIDDETGRQTLYWVTPFNLDYIRRSGFLAQPTVFWRRRAFEEEGPFDERLRYVADCDYWMRVGATRRFVKVNEFLAIERNHASTLREAIGAPLWGELAEVRARYVVTQGPEHDRKVNQHERRRKNWERLYKLGLLTQSFVPGPLRRGPWSRLLNSRSVNVERLRVVLRASQIGKRMPWLHRFAEGDFLRADRSPLEPR